MWGKIRSWVSDWYLRWKQRRRQARRLDDNTDDDKSSDDGYNRNFKTTKTAVSTTTDLKRRKYDDNAYPKEFDDEHDGTTTTKDRNHARARLVSQDATSLRYHWCNVITYFNSVAYGQKHFGKNTVGHNTHKHTCSNSESKTLWTTY